MDSVSELYLKTAAVVAEKDAKGAARPNRNSILVVNQTAKMS